MKFPRIFHLTTSEGVTSDDKVIASDSIFNNMEIVITEKMDGENTCMERNAIHARSENSKDHPSRHLLKAIHAKIAYLIPENIALYGENLFAKHSIEYRNLPKEAFLVFAAIDKDTMTFLSWKDTVKLATSLGFRTVPVLSEDRRGMGMFKPSIQMEPSYSDEIEGCVVRNAQSFKVDDINSNMAKWVRKNHVKTDEHWTQKWVPNKRKE